MHLFLSTGWKALHIAVFETFSSPTDSESNDNTAGEKEEEKEKEKESVDRVKNKDGTVRGILMAVCPLYVKYNR